MIEARQLAWLMAVPKGEKLNRLRLYQDADMEPPIPKASAALYLREILFKIGPTSGDGPISFAEIEAYSRITGADLEPWEADTIFEMSRAFRDEILSAVDPLTIEPMERGNA